MTKAELVNEISNKTGIEKLQVQTIVESSKGQMVFIEGKIRTRHWEKDGVKKYETEIVADNMTLLTRRDSANGSQAGESHHTPASETPPVNTPDGDLPF